MAVRYLDRVIDTNYYPIPGAAASNSRWRPVGLGLMGLQDLAFQLRLPFDDPKMKALSRDIQEDIYFHALWASCELAQQFGPHPAFSETRAAQGVLQWKSWGIEPKDEERWVGLAERIKTVGLRNSLLIAIAPTATIASITGAYECVEPQISNLFKRETLSGDFMQVNKYLVAELKALGKWNQETRDQIKLAEGSIQGMSGVPDEVRAIYRTVWEIPMRSLIDMAIDRGPFIDQGQSLNLFIENPTIGKLSSMYMHAWKKGLKTTYYLRSRPATKIAKSTVSELPAQEAMACSLDKPENCEACQ
jgi:ribonucleoside-diphosphate reductase alpha chain